MARISAREDAYQERLWPEETSDLEKVVNVSSVAQLSPFRYPGGKTWLIPRTIRWLKSIKKPADFIEPFAGGAITSLTVADLRLAEHVTMVEKDDQVAAAWWAIFGGEAEWLANEIITFTWTGVASRSRPISSMNLMQTASAFR